MKGLLLGLALVVVALMWAQAAPAASTSVHVSGTYVVSEFGTTTCVPTGSGSVFRCVTTGFVSQYSGSLMGTSTTSFFQVINCNKGTTSGVGVETFTGSVEGVGSGSLTWIINFHSKFDCATFATSDFSGSGHIVAGTGDLAGLEGKLQFGDVTYEGDLK